MDNQVPIDSHPDYKFMISRLHMDIAGISVIGFLNDGVDHAHHGRAFHPFLQDQLHLAVTVIRDACPGCAKRAVHESMITA